MAVRHGSKILSAGETSLSEFESFMFGSSLVRFGNDFDILVVGPSGEPLSQLKNEIRLAGKNLPLDVLYMLA